MFDKAVPKTKKAPKRTNADRVVATSAAEQALLELLPSLHPGSLSDVLARWILPLVQRDTAFATWPLRLLHLHVMRLRPRAAQPLLAASHTHPLSFAVVEAIRGYRGQQDRVDMLAKALATLSPTIPYVTAGLSSIELEPLARDGRYGLLRYETAATALRAILGTPGSSELTDKTLIMAAALPQWATTAKWAMQVLAELTIAEVQVQPWAVVLDDDVGFEDERRAFLRTAAPRRNKDVSPKHKPTDIRVTIDGDDKILVAFGAVGHFFHASAIDLATATETTRYSESNDAWTVAYDIVNEPDGDAERGLVARACASAGKTLLAALHALTVTATAPASGVERIVWQVQLDGRVRRRPLCARRQKLAKNGRSWSKGVELEPEKFAWDMSNDVSELDRRVALALTTKRSVGVALQLLAGHAHVVDGDGEPLLVVAGEIEVAITDDGGRHRVALLLNGHPLGREDRFDDDVIAVRGTGEKRHQLSIASMTPKIRAVADALERSTVLPATAGADLEAIADRIAGVTTPLRLPLSLQGELRPSASRLIVRLALTDPCRLTARVVVVVGPGAAPVAPGEGEDVMLAFVDGVRVRYQRDREAERSLAAPLRDALLVDEPGDEDWEIVGDDERALLLLQRANDSGVELVWRDQRQLQLVGAIKATSLKVRVSSVRQWLGIDGDVDVDGERISLALLLAASREHRRFIKLGADRYAAISTELRDGLRGVAALTTDESDNGTGVVEVPFAVAHALEALKDSGACFEAGEVWSALAARLDKARAVDDVPPAALSAELRPYQREGLLFLRRLAAFGTGGVLADDMGLGKTVQAIGLLLDRADVGAAVVVAPTSIVFNWQRELERFAPSLRALVYGHADDRAALIKTLGPRDVLIVSYGLVDDAFVDAGFATAIFDEAQAIKNADTARARACRDLDASLKIALSGTPLENHLGELWSLFRVVCPGLLGSMEHFRKHVLLPIERDRSAQHRRQLGQTIRPFLLRRTKAEVLTDLPPLTHQLVDVDSGAAERAIYDALRLEVLHNLDDGSTTTDRRFRVLAGLTRLRLCCCHPVLVEPAYKGSSAKLDEAIATLERVKESGHRALVFSQFVKFLDLVEPAAKAVGLRALRLDGSTPEARRRELVDAFQRGEADVFFLSLKAGGAGLNLTNADVVVHLDPWWNPAVEAQAVSRAHRMGRADPVTAIRIVVRDTIEEAILKMHDDKRELVDAVLAGAGAGSALSIDEIAALLGGRAR